MKPIRSQIFLLLFFTPGLLRAGSFDTQKQALDLMNSGQYEKAEELLTQNDPVSKRLLIELAGR